MFCCGPFCSGVVPTIQGDIFYGNVVYFFVNTGCIGGWFTWIVDTVLRKYVAILRASPLCFSFCCCRSFRRHDFWRLSCSRSFCRAWKSFLFGVIFSPSFFGGGFLFLVDFFFLCCFYYFVLVCVGFHRSQAFYDYFVLNLGGWPRCLLWGFSKVLCKSGNDVIKF